MISVGHFLSFDTCFLFGQLHPEKILKLSLLVETVACSCKIDLLFDLPLLVDMKTEIMILKYHIKWMISVLKYVICGRMKKELSNLKMKDRHLNQKTIRRRWVIRF